MKKLIVLNHKMNMEYDEVIPYINTLNNIETDNNIIIVFFLIGQKFLNYTMYHIEKNYAIRKSKK